MTVYLNFIPFTLYYEHITVNQVPYNVIPPFYQKSENDGKKLVRLLLDILKGSSLILKKL